MKNEHGGPTGDQDRCLHVPAPVFSQIADGDAGSLASQRATRLRANALRPTTDDRDLPLESHFSTFSSVE